MAQSNEHLARAERELVAVDPADKARIGANCNVVPVRRTGCDNSRPQQYHRRVSVRKAVADRTIVASAAPAERATGGDNHDLPAWVADEFIAELGSAVLVIEMEPEL